LQAGQNCLKSLYLTTFNIGPGFLYGKMISVGKKVQEMKEIIDAAELFVKNELGKDSSGHDWHHIDRVRKNARLIWSKEQVGDWFIIEMAALLHDIPDEKLNESEKAGWAKLNSFLQGVKLESHTVQKIKDCIETVSFKGGREIDLSSIEAEIVQDADRLDALGAIGIARTFAFGGKKGHPIFDPGLNVREEMTLEEYRSGNSSSVNHFYEKLLKLKDKMNTAHAKQLAEERHHFMETFLAQFYSEWNGKA
jgi:uncharacterized protein